MPPALRRTAPQVLLGLYVLFVLVITLTPQMPAAPTVGTVVTQVLTAAHERGFTWLDFLTIEFVGNIVFFVPLGTFTALVLGARLRWLLLSAGTILSAFVELGQLLLLPSRFSELRDLMSNTIGYLLGVGLVLLIRMIRDRRGNISLRGAG